MDFNIFAMKVLLAMLLAALMSQQLACLSIATGRLSSHLNPRKVSVEARTCSFKPSTPFPSGIFGRQEIVPYQPQ